MDQAKAHKSGIPDAVLQSLQDRYLLTTELRAGGTWFELTHDRLVVPIRADNRAWFEEHMSTLQRQAALWDKERRPDRTARLWDATTGRQRLHFAGRSGPVSWAACSPDGASIITAGADRTACIWDAGVGQVMLQLTGHWSRVYAAAYSPDGRRVVTASDDGTARIWNAQTGREELRLTSSAGALSAAAFSPDGTHVATSSYDGIARIWPATPEGLLSLAESRIQQDSLRLMPEERLRYELD